MNARNKRVRDVCAATGTVVALVAGLGFMGMGSAAADDPTAPPTDTSSSVTTTTDTSQPAATPDAPAPSDTPVTTPAAPAAPADTPATPPADTSSTPAAPPVDPTAPATVKAAVASFTVAATGVSVEKYNVAAWAMGPNSSAADPFVDTQNFSGVNLKETTENLNALDLTLLGNPAYCGVLYQVDLYVDNATTDSLLAGGKLYGSHNPEEVFPNDPLQHWKFVQAPSCAAPVFTQTDVKCQAPNSAPGITNEKSYTLPVLPAGWKYALESDGVTRPAAGTWYLAPNTSITITAHTLATQPTQNSVTQTFTAGPQRFDQDTNANGDCYKPPVACVASGPWGTEDKAPTATAAGLAFNGPSVQAVDIYQHIVSGNLQGITSASITYANTVNIGQPAQAVFEFNPNAPLNGSSSNTTFATASANLPAGTTGTTINLMDPSVKWSTTKLTYGTSNPGSLGDPVAWSDFVALFPDSVLGAQGIHLLSNSTANDTSTVAVFNTSCGELNNVWPSVTFPTDSTSPATCQSDEAAHTFSYTLPEAPANTKYELVDGVRPAAGTYYLGDGETAGPFVLHTLASAQVQQGSVTFGPYTGEDEIPTQYTNSDAPCYQAPTVVETVPPTVTNGTCVANKPVDGSATTFDQLVALQPEGVIATLNDGNLTDGTFSADTSFVLADDAITTFHLGTPVNKTAAECNPPVVLAFTGGTIGWGAGIVGGVMTLVGLAFLLFWPRRRTAE